MAEVEVKSQGRANVLASMEFLIERLEDLIGMLGSMYKILVLRMMMRDDVPLPTSTNHAQSIINGAAKAIPCPSITDNMGGRCIHDLEFKPAG